MKHWDDRGPLIHRTGTIVSDDKGPAYEIVCDIYGFDPVKPAQFKPLRDDVVKPDLGEKMSLFLWEFIKDRSNRETAA